MDKVSSSTQCGDEVESTKNENIANYISVKPRTLVRGKNKKLPAQAERKQVRLSDTGKNSLDLYKQQNESGATKKCKLHRYIFENNKLKVLQYLAELENVKKLNKQDENGRSPVYFAAGKENACILKMLLSFKGVDIFKEDKDGKSPFFNAADNGSLACMKELLKHGANPCQTDKNLNSPLYHVISNHGDKYLNCVRFLINDCDYFVQSKNSRGQTALHVAASHGRAAIVEYLLENEFLVNDRDVEGRTPMVLAVKANEYETVELLINHGADAKIVDKSNKNAFDYASEGGRIELLLKEACKCTSHKATTKKSIPDSDEVNALKKNMDKLRKKIDDVIEEEHRMIKENTILENKMEEDTDKKINQNKYGHKIRQRFFQEVRHTRDRLLQKETHQARRSFTEEEQNKEMNDLEEKWERLDKACKDLTLTNNEKCHRIQNVAERITHVDGKDKELQNLIQELNVEVQETVKASENELDEEEYEELKIELENIQDENCKTNINWADNSDEIDREIKEATIELTQKNKELVKAKNRVKLLRDEASVQREEITNVTEKTARLLAKYNKLKERVRDMQK
ncbi:ankycorbin-like [Hydractinia symbiolongicarpus]|uniref:ankycorbin-like n=1 Tax=Hydractinia symbiolongicarpus TaxID=13093 RepID=UPI0025505F15|nr:ankycorbin-like [Hydractinia symbiolongicarpus]